MITNIIIYLFKVNIALILLYFLYRLLIDKEKNFFQIKRGIIISSILLSFLLPLAFFPSNTESVINNNSFEETKEIFDEFNHEFTSIQTSYIDQVEDTATLDYQSYFLYAYFFIGSIFIIRLVIGISIMIAKILASKRIKYGNHQIILLNKSESPFSFFKFIFINSQDLDYKSKLEHEKAHCKQLHTLDLIFIEIASAFLWMNPLIFLFKKHIVELHEYLADDSVLKNGIDIEEYCTAIISQAKQNVKLRLASNFNNSLTKKRLKMITKSNGSKLNSLRYLMIVPMIFTLAILFAFSNVEPQKIVSNIPPAAEALYMMKDDGNKPHLLPLNVCTNSDYRISSEYGMRIHPVLKVKKMHTGIDFSAKKGIEIIASTDGVIREAKESGKYGLRVIIDHDNTYSTLYAHMSGFKVQKGDKVNAGDVIGYVGNTGEARGSHLHYAVMKNGKYVNPADYFGEK